MSCIWPSHLYPAKSRQAFCHWLTECWDFLAAAPHFRLEPLLAVALGVGRDLLVKAAVEDGRGSMWAGEDAEQARFHSSELCQHEEPPSAAISLETHSLHLCFFIIHIDSNNDDDNYDFIGFFTKITALLYKINKWCSNEGNKGFFQQVRIKHEEKYI